MIPKAQQEKTADEKAPYLSGLWFSWDLSYSMWVLDAGSSSYSVIISLSFAHFALVLSYLLCYWLICIQCFIGCFTTIFSCRESSFLVLHWPCALQRAYTSRWYLYLKQKAGHWLFIKLENMLPWTLSSCAAPAFLKTSGTSQPPGRHFHVISLIQTSIAFSSSSWEYTMRLFPEVCQCRSFN